MPRLGIAKTWKLFIGGAFPRTESGRSAILHDEKDRVIAHLCRGSRKDLRNAVEVARKALDGWAARDAYNRGQILYRMAEMAEARHSELVDAITATGGVTAAAAKKETNATIDRLVSFAGWCDKFAQVVGCRNPVSGPYHDFTMPEPTGVCGVIAPDSPSLLGLISYVAPILAGSNTLVALASEANPLPAMVFAEICATSDVPGGVVNILSGSREELLSEFANHRDIDAISGHVVKKSDRTTLELGAADNMKRVRLETSKIIDYYDTDTRHSPWTIEPFTEYKTIWHPSGA